MSEEKPADKPEAAGAATAATAEEEEEEEDNEQVRRDMMRLLAGSGIAAHEAEELVKKDFKFWKTQPVPALGERVSDHGPIDEPKTVDDVRKEPLKLPKGFVWDVIDVNNQAQVEELYSLLTENYVEDDDNLFRFDYSVEFLRWALTPPGYKPDWLVAVRQESNGRLLAFISGIPVRTDVYHHKAISMAEINFLCVHKRLRSKRLAPVLIKEVTRRVNLCDMWQAVYTAGVVLPRPVTRARYWHRSLNPKKLIEIGFSRLAPRMTMARTIKLYRLPEAPQLPGWREMEPRDVPTVAVMLNSYLEQFKLKVHFSEEEVAHWLLPRAGVVHSYVVQHPDTGAVTEFGSFYLLPSTVIGNDKYRTLSAAYCYYCVNNDHSLADVVKDCMIMANKAGCDVFNCLDVMHNKEFLTDLKFGIGDGNLQYYLYNWKCPEMDPKDLGLVLL